MKAGDSAESSAGDSAGLSSSDGAAELVNVVELVRVVCACESDATDASESCLAVSTASLRVLLLLLE